MRTRSDGVARRLAGSRKGAAQVAQAFNDVVTRKKFCAAVEIHPTTLRRWERAGQVSPTLREVLGIPTYVFTERDVRFGKEIKRAIREGNGSLSLEQAAERARQSLRH